MTDNVTPISSVPEKRLEELLSAPRQFGTPAIVDGRVINQLTVARAGDRVQLRLDNRLGIDVPAEHAVSVCWLVANALAIGAGYSHLGAETKERPFAPKVVVFEGDA